MQTAASDCIITDLESHQTVITPMFIGPLPKLDFYFTNGVISKTHQHSAAMLFVVRLDDYQ